jgi:2-polyprenyl-3-methyl-5-hydroxy-6-metoxy-1,4-benzoquinol methylase
MQASGFTEAWQAHYRRAAFEKPAHPEARDFLDRDLRETLKRWIPPEASVVDVSCGTGELLAALPNPRAGRRGLAARRGRRSATPATAT